MTTTDKILESQKPYFVRALYDWISDQDQTVYVQVNARHFGVIVPESYIDPITGCIILNFSRAAVSNLKLDKHHIEAYARFGGVAHRLKVPMSAILSIYAKETGTGMTFAPPPARAAWPEKIDPVDDHQSDSESPVPLRTAQKGPPNLKILKNPESCDKKDD